MPGADQGEPPKPDQQSVDIEAYKAGPIPEMEEIRRLDSQLHEPDITFQEQLDAELRFNELISKFSKKAKISSASIRDQLRYERLLQEEVDRAIRELAKTKERWDTIIGTGAKPPETPGSGRIKADPGLELPARRPGIPFPTPTVHEKFTPAPRESSGNK